MSDWLAYVVAVSAAFLTTMLLGQLRWAGRQTGPNIWTVRKERSR
jgi:hypothetical protein